MSWCTLLGLACACQFYSLCKRAVFVSNFLSRTAFLCASLSWGSCLEHNSCCLGVPLSVSHVHVDFIIIVNVQLLFPTVCPGLPLSVQDEMFGNKILEAARARLHALDAQEYCCTGVLWLCVAALKRASAVGAARRRGLPLSSPCAGSLPFWVLERFAFKQGCAF